MLILNKINKLDFKINLILSFLIIMIIFINVNIYKKEENKLSLLKYMPNKYIPKTKKFIKMNIKKLNYPFILKPNKCSRCSKDVKVIKDKNELDDYLKENSKKLNKILYQDFIPFKNEVGILYERDLFTNKGRIVSITQKKSSNYEIMAGCGKDVECDNLTRKITPELNKVICEISDCIPGFNVGRYDIKYENEKLLFEGKNFYILEANSCMGFDLRKDTTNIISSNLYINRWFLHRFFYGLKNIFTLNGYTFFENIDLIFSSVKNAINCNYDWEKLFCRYS
jgi:glutathione synthase/RimK-type ligase-like ATP-grasp enzyme